MMDAREIGDRLKELRERVGLTCQQMGPIVGCTGQHYSNLETGKSRLRLDTLQLFCQAIHKPVEHFFNDCGGQMPAPKIDIDKDIPANIVYDLFTLLETSNKIALSGKEFIKSLSSIKAALDEQGIQRPIKRAG